MAWRQMKVVVVMVGKRTSFGFSDHSLNVLTMMVMQDRRERMQELSQLGIRQQKQQQGRERDRSEV